VHQDRKKQDIFRAREISTCFPRQSGYESEGKEQNPRGPGTYPVTAKPLLKVCTVARF
jgi:hypothetical protein